MILTVCSLVVDAGVVPPHSGPWPYFVAAQDGLVSAVCTCLLVNGFVGFQLYEDGTGLSVWLLRASSAGMFVISFVVSLFTFKEWGGLDPANPVGVFVVVYILNAIFLFIYVVMQLMLVYNTLEDRWPLGHIALGVFFFTAGQVVLYAFSQPVCNGTEHYLDGLFIATLCNLFAVMMIYKVIL
jgi:Chitin synthase export chaperone